MVSVGGFTLKVPPVFSRLTRRSQLAAVGFAFLFLIYVVSSLRHRIWNAMPEFITGARHPRHLVAHYYSEGIDVNEDVCTLHGWGYREGKEPELWDAIILEDELEMEMLELRMHELDIVVNKFIIIESNITSDGKPKRLLFGEQQHQPPWDGFRNKLVYRVVEGPRKPSPHHNKQAWQKHLRESMTALIRTRVPNTVRPPLVLFSLISEIPSPQTLFILKTCAFPAPMHFQLRNFLYSYEWPFGPSWSWRAQVHEWDSPTKEWTHEFSSDYALAESGWHCNYCYKDLESYRNAGSSLSLDSIQKKLCSGTDMFNLLSQTNSATSEPSKAVVNMPRYMLENWRKFKYLLPGGCKRDASPN